MKSIKTILPHISFIDSSKNKQWKLNLIRRWDKIIGELSSKISIHKIYNNSITLAVSDTNWMNELYFMSNIIKNKINKSLDKPRIEKVRLKYVSKKERKEAVIKKVETFKPKRDLTIREKKALEEIHDPELSTALTILLNKCL